MGKSDQNFFTRSRFITACGIDDDGGGGDDDVEEENMMQTIQ